MELSEHAVSSQGVAIFPSPLSDKSPIIASKEVTPFSILSIRLRQLGCNGYCASQHAVI
jgi:hypothetical protein